jgi:transcriptional regulator with XRE-family HTH domain
MNNFSPSENVRHVIMQIGRNLKTARKRRQKTIREIAEMVGASVSTIQRLEKGDPAVKFSIYLTIAEVFQLTDTMSFAAPESDLIGLALEKQRLPQRVRSKKVARLDF